MNLKILPVVMLILIALTPFAYAQRAGPTVNIFFEDHIVGVRGVTAVNALVSIQVFDPNGSRKAVAQALSSNNTGEYEAKAVYRFTVQDPSGNWTISVHDRYRGTTNKTFLMMAPIEVVSTVTVTETKTAVKVTTRTATVTATATETLFKHYDVTATVTKTQTATATVTEIVPVTMTVEAPPPVEMPFSSYAFVIAVIIGLVVVSMLGVCVWKRRRRRTQ